MVADSCHLEKNLRSWCIVNRIVVGSSRIESLFGRESRLRLCIGETGFQLVKNRRILVRGWGIFLEKLFSRRRSGVGGSRI